MLALLRSLHRHRRLIREFIVRDLKARYVGSTMGFFWSVIFPLINLAVYLFVFRLILNTRWSEGTSATQTALTMLAGILVWGAFAETIGRSTNCLVEHSNLIQKVVFPSEILPPFLCASSLVNMAVGLPIVLLAVLFLDPQRTLGIHFQPDRFSAGLLALPLLVVLQGVFMIGLGYVMAMLNLYVRDTVHVIGVLMTVWMFATPIFYPDFMVDPSLAPAGTFVARGVTGNFAWLLDVNPMYWLIECYRDVMVHARWPEPVRLVRFAGVAVLVFAAGSTFFMRHRRDIPDLL